MQKTSPVYKQCLIVLPGVLSIGLLFSVYLYNLDNHSLLYYGDSVSHLVRTREFIDSINPGLFEQLGTVWLPVPHLLLLPFSLIDSLFKTGFAGLAVSLPSLAITSVFLCKIIKIQIGDISYIAIAGALLYASNPNILYLGIISMTEAPFMLFFVASAYYFQKWVVLSPNYADLQEEAKSSVLQKKLFSLSQINISTSSRQSLYSLIKCSVFISLATLCRYEAWIIPVFLVPFVTIAVAKKNKNGSSGYYSYYDLKNKVAIILISILSFSGIALWLMWNTYHHGDPLEFSNTQFFSAASQALEGSIRETLYLQPWNVISLYCKTALVMYGPVFLVSVIGGYIFYRYFYKKGGHNTKTATIYLFLALPPIFTTISMVLGIGEMNQKNWFNSRFLILLAPFLILLTCIFLRIFSKTKIRVALIFGILFIYQILVTPALGLVITFLDAQNQFFSPKRLSIIKTAETLNSIYDGNSSILVIAGSSQYNSIMQASGIPLREFDQILGSGAHKNSFKDPWLYVKYLILAKKPDSSARDVSQYWLDRQSILDKNFDVVYEDEYYKILVLSDSFSLSQATKEENIIIKDSKVLSSYERFESPSLMDQFYKIYAYSIRNNFGTDFDPLPKNPRYVENR